MCINVIIRGIITGTQGRIGGIVGNNDNARIKECYNNANISGNYRVGGVTGYNSQGDIIQCYNNIAISGDKMVGGISGENQRGNINLCYNLGNITTTIKEDEYAGGISGGNMNGSILNSYNTGNITCYRGAGITGYSTNDSSIQNCYNIGQIISEFKVYAAIVAYTNRNEITLLNNYYLENCINGTNDITVINGITPIATEELKNIASKLGDAYKEDTNHINNGFPILSWQ